MRRNFWWSVARLIEVVLITVGMVALVRYGWMTLEMWQREWANREAATRLLNAPETSSSPFATDPDPEFIGKLDIPRLNITAAVRVGDDDEVLAGAIGYLSDTPLPWAHGNTTFAAHRDRIFRPLADIQVGDEIRLWTRHGNFSYAVSRTFVVNPTDLWVLDDADGVDLTLITCYPFVYVGRAPQRFVVRARKLEPY
ncbi:MAG TPA: class D sortase [Vicinamibacterales bacterium]|nr:class D sortase [Vicinamibacterales bacterium]